MRSTSGQNSPNHIKERLNWYTSFGLQNSEEALSSFVAEQQAAVFDDTATYNQAFHKLYDTSQSHQSAWSQMESTYDELVEQQHSNETALHVWLALSLRLGRHHHARKSAHV